MAERTNVLQLGIKRLSGADISYGSDIPPGVPIDVVIPIKSDSGINLDLIVLLSLFEGSANPWAEHGPALETLQSEVGTIKPGETVNFSFRIIPNGTGEPKRDLEVLVYQSPYSGEEPLAKENFQDVFYINAETTIKLTIGQPVVKPAYS